jgi:type VI secretion system protein VasJ
MTPEQRLQASAGATSASNISAGMALWQNWLAPLSESNPTGDDPAYEDDFQAMRDEINKLSGMDADLLCQIAETLLCENVKDIRVITWYILARLVNDGEKGLAEGLLLLCAMVERFGDKLHPQRANARKAAFEWLNSEKVLNVLARWPEVVPEDASLIAGSLVKLSELTQRLPENERPLLAGLCTALQQRLDGSGGSDAMLPQNSSSVSTTAQPSSLTLSAVKSGRDLLDQGKLLSAWLSEQPAGWLASHRLMKTLRWDTVDVIPPMNANSCTRLPPPKAEYRAQLKRLYLQQNWIELVEYASQMFCEGVNHFSLDVQWYLWQGLSRAGAPWEQYADYVVSDLALLLERLKGLETLAWDDGTPYADEVTLNWINEKVKGSNSGFGEEAAVMVNSDADDVLALEAEAMAKGDSEGPEVALAWLQTRPGTTSARSRWLMRLVMARIAEQFGRNEMALHLLGELSDSAPQMTVIEWEPTLMFEVYSRRLRLLRMKSSRSETDKTRLTPEMDKLIAAMIQIDPSRAFVLCN